MPTLAEIQAQIEEQNKQMAALRRQADELIAQKKAEVLEEIRKTIAEYGITAADLKLGAVKQTGAKRAAAPPKEPAAVAFRNAEGLTWSGGRGRKPKWVEEVLARGESMEQYRVQ